MKPFNHDPCPKCDASPFNRTITYRYGTRTPYGEHLTVTCGFCDYQYWMYTADHPTYGKSRCEEQPETVHEVSAHCLPETKEDKK